jgi:hypothetical protein
VAEGAEVSRRMLAVWLSIFAGVMLSGIGWVAAGQRDAERERLGDVQRITRLERDQVAMTERLEMVYAVIGERLKAIDSKLERIADRTTERR